MAERKPQHYSLVKLALPSARALVGFADPSPQAVSAYSVTVANASALRAVSKPPSVLTNPVLQSRGRCLLSPGSTTRAICRRYRGGHRKCTYGAGISLATVFAVQTFRRQKKET